MAVFRSSNILANNFLPVNWALDFEWTMDDQSKNAIKEFKFWLEWSGIIFPMLLVINLVLIYLYGDEISLKIIICSIFSGCCAFLRGLFDALNKSFLAFLALIGTFFPMFLVTTDFNDFSDVIYFFIMVVTFATSASGSHYINVKCKFYEVC